MKITLPALPDETVIGYDRLLTPAKGEITGYTEEQMQVYARQAIREYVEGLSPSAYRINDPRIGRIYITESPVTAEVMRLEEDCTVQDLIIKPELDDADE